MKDLITEARELCAVETTAELDILRLIECTGELCDALEKAEAQNKRLMHEVCKLACESVERDRALAKLEAEVMTILGDKE